MEEYVDEKAEILASQESYISKEKFIAMIQELNFIAIKTARIEFITSFKYNGKSNVSSLGYDIEIE